MNGPDVIIGLVADGKLLCSGAARQLNMTPVEFIKLLNSRGHYAVQAHGGRSSASNGRRRVSNTDHGFEKMITGILFPTLLLLAIGFTLLFRLHKTR
jgi:hypothetical protein